MSASSEIYVSPNEQSTDPTTVTIRDDVQEGRQKLSITRSVDIPCNISAANVETT